MLKKNFGGAANDKSIPLPGLGFHEEWAVMGGGERGGGVGFPGVIDTRAPAWPPELQSNPGHTRPGRQALLSTSTPIAAPSPRVPTGGTAREAGVWGSTQLAGILARQEARERLIPFHSPAQTSLPFSPSRLSGETLHHLPASKSNQAGK